MTRAAASGVCCPPGLASAEVIIGAFPLADGPVALEWDQFSAVQAESQHRPVAADVPRTR